ncbi:MAG: TIGR02594 family protein [Proteobacteria bacterium]|nr:TIGR02594 family protein [Pseudomonadota bacterium]
MSKFLAWLKSLFNPQKETPPVVPIIPKLPALKPETEIETPYSFALLEDGVKEIKGDKHNPRIIEYHSTTGDFTSDEVAWCSSFVNWCCLKAGYQRSKSATARSWHEMGKDVTNSPRVGDIVVLKRLDSSWRGHVGFYVNMDEKYIYMYGGNQHDSVNVSKYYRKGGSYGLLSIRRVRKQ